MRSHLCDLTELIIKLFNIQVTLDFNTLMYDGVTNTLILENPLQLNNLFCLCANQKRKA